MIARTVQHSFSKTELSRKYNLHNVCKYCKSDRRRQDNALKTESSSSSTFARSQVPLFCFVLCRFPLARCDSHCAIPVLMDFWCAQVSSRKWKVGKHFLFFKLLTLQ